MKVAIQGERGAFSHQAALELLPKAEVLPCSRSVEVFDALDSEAIARAEREAISSTIKQPVRYLVSSTFHDPYSKGNLAYADVFKIGHENYRAGLLDQMQRGKLSTEEQRARMPNAAFRDRMSLYLGGKEIQVLYFGPAHTRGDSIIFVPQDRIAYLSEVFFLDEFPNMAGGYGVAWIQVLERVLALDADIFVPGHGPIPEDAKATRAGLQRLRQLPRGIATGTPSKKLRVARPKIRWSPR